MFTQSSFGPISSHGNSDMPNIWTYRTDDTTDQVLVAGYFDIKKPIINDGDFIQVSASDAKLTGIFKKVGGVLSVDAATNRKQVLVTKPSDLSGILDSTLVYFIDGVIDMGSQSIEVPQGGLTLAGYSFDVSKLISSEDNYTMFTSPVGGSGNLLGRDYAIEVTGTNSQVYNLKSDNGFKAFEFARINYNGCSSLGVIDNYRQGLETGTGRFGGKPELTLKGTWVGGYFIETSIVRSLTDGAYSLFKAGDAFVMNSRFRTNQNIDLPASASFFDFSPSNFVNPSTVQVTGAIVSRAGVFDATDANITPNIDQTELVCSWSDNNGMPNTLFGGEAIVSSESASVISQIGTYVDLAGTFNTTDLQHFDSPANGQLRHLGVNPREYQLAGQFVLESGSNDVVALKAVIYRSATTSFEDQKVQKRVINNLAGARNVGFYVFLDNITLEQNDYVKFQVANETSTTDVTAELDSFFTVNAR